MELKFKESKKNYYILTILGSIRTGKYSQKYETIVSQCSDKNWSDIDALFFSYIAKGESGSWRESRNYEANDKDGAHYGRDFKYGPVGPYIGFWCNGGDEDSIKLNWDHICSVTIQHVNESGVIEDVIIPDIDTIFATEEEFMKAFTEAADKRANEIGHDIDETGMTLEPWDLPLIRKILIANGWDEKRVNNIFFDTCDTGFVELIDQNKHNDENAKICKVLKSIRQAHDANGKRYNGFRKETLSIIERCINGTEMTNVMKEVVMDVLHVYNDMEFIDSYNVERIANDLIELQKIRGINTTSCGTSGYSGMYITKVLEDTEYDPEDYAEDAILTYEGETYLIHETD